MCESIRAAVTKGHRGAAYKQRDLLLTALEAARPPETTVPAWLGEGLFLGPRGRLLCPHKEEGRGRSVGSLTRAPVPSCSMACS